MDISRLNISIPNYQTAFEEGTVTYTIFVEYGGLSWEVWRRYSQFTQLYQDLEDDGFCALPRLPPKTLTGPPQDPDALAERRQRLELFLRGLMRRPDTRTSPQLHDFLLFNEQTNMEVEPLRPACVCSTGVQRFAASALAYSATRMLLVVGHEDKTGLSRLGRLWSIVEPDEFGLVNFWRVEGDFSCLTLLYSFKTQAKVRCMHLDDATGQLFVGHDGMPCSSRNNSSSSPQNFQQQQHEEEKQQQQRQRQPQHEWGSSSNSRSEAPTATLAAAAEGTQQEQEQQPQEEQQLQQHGNIAVYAFPMESSAVEKVAVLPLHHAAVMRLSAGETERRRLLSIGYDGAMRVFEIASHRVVCGGRLSQRLLQPQGKSSILTAALLHDEKDIAFLGTSAGQLLVYRVKNNPPEYMQSCMLQRPSRSVEALHIDKSLLYVAHGECISLLSIEWRRDNVKLVKVAGLQLPGASPAALCMTFQSQLQHLFVGYDPAIAWWSVKAGEPLCVFDGHRGGTHQLLVACGGQLLISGGDSGNTKVWRLPPAEEMLLWEGRDSSSSSASSAAAREQQCESHSSSRYIPADSVGTNGEGRKAEVRERSEDAAAGAGASDDETESLFPSAVRSRPSSLLTQLPPAAATAARAVKAAAATAAAAAERCIQAGVERLPVAAQLPSSLCNRMPGGSNSGGYDSRSGYNICNSHNSSSIENENSNYCSGSEAVERRSTSAESSSSRVREEQHMSDNTAAAATASLESASSAPAAAAPAAGGFLRPLVGAGTAGEDDDDDETLNDLRSAFR